MLFIGKSSITLRFVYDEFEESYDPTKADSYRKVIKDPSSNDSKLCQIDILDTAGQEEYAAIRDNYYRSGEGFVLVYSINDLASFTAMNDFRAQILRSLNDTNIPLLLVGNKSDLIRKISQEDALGMIDRWTLNSKESLVKWREVSAKNDDGIDEIFTEIVKLIQRKREIEGEKMRKGGGGGGINGNNKRKNGGRFGRCFIQ